LTDVPDHLLQEIHHFFEVYKALEPHKEADVRGWDSREAALVAIEDARRAYAETHADPNGE
ncbi:MAG TPA: inorganic diphosphatase, partial [Acidimicrobiales bacterium]